MRDSLSRISLSPMIGELTAAQLGAQSVFSGSASSDYFRYSTDQINRFLTQRGFGIVQQDRVEVMPPGYDPSRDMPYPRGQRPPDQQGGSVNVIGQNAGLELPAWSLTKWLSEWFVATDAVSKNAKQSMFLLLVAIIIIAAGFFSLR